MRHLMTIAAAGRTLPLGALDGRAQKVTEVSVGPSGEWTPLENFTARDRSSGWREADVDVPADWQGQVLLRLLRHFFRALIPRGISGRRICLSWT